MREMWCMQYLEVVFAFWVIEPLLDTFNYYSEIVFFWNFCFEKVRWNHECIYVYINDSQTI